MAREQSKKHVAKETIQPISAPPLPRPRVFIGSAGDKLSVAAVLEEELKPSCEVTLWTRAFRPSGPLLTGILKLIQDYDAGVFVFGASDVTESKGELFASVRDNVLFEIGVFMGGVGVERTFLLAEDSESLKIPSDMAGLLRATYANEKEVREKSRVIRGAIEALGPAIKSTYNELLDLKAWVDTQEIFVRKDARVYRLSDLLRTAVRARQEPWYSGTHPRSLMLPILDAFSDAAADDCYWELVVHGVFRFVDPDYFADDYSWNWKSSVDYVALSSRGVALLNVLRAEMTAVQR